MLRILTVGYYVVKLTNKAPQAYPNKIMKKRIALYHIRASGPSRFYAFLPRRQLLKRTSKNAVHGSTSSLRTAFGFNECIFPFIRSLSKDEISVF
jgi:hypothetical protein